MSQSEYQSDYQSLAPVQLPHQTGTRVMMMPLVLHDCTTVPPQLSHYLQTIDRLFSLTPADGVAYLTIDEREVAAGTTHRRAGVHVDSVYRGGSGAWGGGGGWGKNGMICLANQVGCRAWRGDFEGFPADEGEADHLVPQLGDPEVLQAGVAYWMSPMCVHESIRQPKTVSRQFVRLSMPSNSPWFEGYTVNPLGVQPTGPILPRRPFM